MLEHMDIIVTYAIDKIVVLRLARLNIWDLLDGQDGNIVLNWVFRARQSRAAIVRQLLGVSFRISELHQIRIRTVVDTIVSVCWLQQRGLESIEGRSGPYGR